MHIATPINEYRANSCTRTKIFPLFSLSHIYESTFLTHLPSKTGSTLYPVTLFPDKFPGKSGGTRKRA
ncbi:hypothetical protein DSO57_1017552 [Entomophthora muscae]|uniref:Uncharacterized protein n=1 Tax=Entomophthora muscae TaxID=34485 RepID=A0ACC2STP8_9FUNG|nr:hypothetical protein DSO57_1017552 [Entomophthora muscae]